MTRAQELTAIFLKGFGAVIKTVEALTDEQWRLKTAEEGWTVGVVAHHLAVTTGLDQITWGLSGHSTPLFADMNAADAENARHARDFVDCTKEETLEVLKDVASRAEAVFSALTDEQLKTTGLAVGGGPTTVEQLMLIMFPLHIESHHGSILKTIS